MYEDGTIGTKERSIQVGVSLSNNWSNQDHAQKLFTLAKYMESPCEAITYQIAKDAYINPEEGLKRKAS
jgi:hypothetical protein